MISQGIDLNFFNLIHCNSIFASMKTIFCGILTFICVSNSSAQSLDINTFSFRQSIYSNAKSQDFFDTVKVSINENYLIKGEDKFKVISVIQSNKVTSKYRIYYLAPVNVGDFDFDVKVAEFNTAYNELKLTLGSSSFYFLYLK